MITNPISKEVKISVLEDGATAATGTLTGSTLDMSNFDSVVFLAAFGTSNAGNYIYVEQGDESDLSDAADIAGSKMVATANNELLVLDIVKPGDRYLRPYSVRGASSTLSPLIAIQYNTNKLPVTNADSGEVQVEVHISPAEGTA